MNEFIRDITPGTMIVGKRRRGNDDMSFCLFVGVMSNKFVYVFYRHGEWNYGTYYDTNLDLNTCFLEEEWEKL